MWVYIKTDNKDHPLTLLFMRNASLLSLYSSGPKLYTLKIRFKKPNEDQGVSSITGVLIF